MHLVAPRPLLVKIIRITGLSGLLPVMDDRLPSAR
jgi:hypothetical protein